MADNNNRDSNYGIIKTGHTIKKINLLSKIRIFQICLPYVILHKQLEVIFYLGNVINSLKMSILMSQ